MVPALVVVVDRAVAGNDASFLGVLARLGPQLPDDGTVWVQLRAKGQEGVLDAAAQIVHGWSTPVLVNGDEALAEGLDLPGVHWPEHKIPAGRARARFRCASVHSAAAADGAARAGAQCVLFSPVFAPRCKDGEGVGIAALRELVSRCPVPVLALGGITPERVPLCLDAGAVGVAVLTPVLQSDFDWRRYVLRDRVATNQSM